MVRETAAEVSGAEVIGPEVIGAEPTGAEPTAPGELMVPADLGFALVAERLAIIVGSFNRRLRPATGGLSHGMLSALASVAKHGPLRLAELAQFEIVSAPSATRLVADLEARGLVIRNSDPLDGRAALIETTALGREAVLMARAARTEVIAELIDGLGEDDLQIIEAALPALERAIRRE